MYVNVVNATRLKTQVPVTVLVFVYHVLGKYSSKVKQQIVFSKATEIHLPKRMHEISSELALASGPICSNLHKCLLEIQSNFSTLLNFEVFKINIQI